MKSLSLLMLLLLVGCANTPPIATSKSNASCAHRQKQLIQRYCALLLSEKNGIKTSDSFDAFGKDALEQESANNSFKPSPFRGHVMCGKLSQRRDHKTVRLNSGVSATQCGLFAFDFSNVCVA